MQVAVPQLTTVLLLVHMVLGCCWHHGHACEVDASILAAHGEGCGLHDEGPEGRNTSHEAPGQDEENCEGDRCTFVRTKSSFEDDPSSTVAARVVDDLVPVMHVPAGLNLEKISRGANSFPGRPLLPVKAHLLFRVLLI